MNNLILIFLNLKSDILEQVNCCYDQQNDGNIENAMNMASCDLVKTAEMNKDYEFCNSLQNDLGPLSTAVNEKSVAQLQKENREKRKVSPNQAYAHLPINDSSLALVSLPTKKK